ncbi:MAG: hypothetical protein ACFCVE_02495 [Phycisphaerae bacterium]
MSFSRIGVAIVVGVASSAGLVLLGGCGSSRLETGYQYVPLGTSSSQRQAFYADPFSPEARAAADGEQRRFQSRRPD